MFTAFRSWKFRSCAFCLRDFADARVLRGDEFAGADSGLLEVGSVGGQDLPTGDFLSEDGDGAHVRKVSAETLMMFWRRGQPDAIIGGGLVPFVAQDQNNFSTDV